MGELFFSSELFPLCFKVISTFTENQRSVNFKLFKILTCLQVALLIILRAMYNREGLEYFCTPLEKLNTLLIILEQLTLSTVHRKSRIQKTLVYIYYRLSDHSRCVINFYFIKISLAVFTFSSISSPRLLEMEHLNLFLMMIPRPTIP